MVSVAYESLSGRTRANTNTLVARIDLNVARLRMPPHPRIGNDDIGFAVPPNRLKIEVQEQ